MDGVCRAPTPCQFEAAAHKLLHPESDCCALQVKGKGYWGKEEGIENMYSLPDAASAFVQNPYNYERVQVQLSPHPYAWLLLYL